jgi:hypothetical protein
MFDGGWKTDSRLAILATLTGPVRSERTAVYFAIVVSLLTALIARLV